MRGEELAPRQKPVYLPDPKHPQIQNLGRLHLPGLHQDPDVLPHALAVEEGHGILAGFGAGVLKVVEEAAGGEPEGLAGEGHGAKTCRLAGLAASAEKSTWAVRSCSPTRTNGFRWTRWRKKQARVPCLPDADVQEALALEAVVAGDQEAAPQTAGQLAVKRHPAGARSAI